MDAVRFWYLCTFQLFIFNLENFLVPQCLKSLRIYSAVCAESLNHSQDYITVASFWENALAGFLLLIRWPLLNSCTVWGCNISHCQRNCYHSPPRASLGNWLIEGSWQLWNRVRQCKSAPFGKKERKNERKRFNNMNWIDLFQVEPWKKKVETNLNLLEE